MKQPSHGASGKRKETVMRLEHPYDLLADGEQPGEALFTGGEQRGSVLLSRGKQQGESLLACGEQRGRGLVFGGEQQDFDALAYGKERAEQVAGGARQAEIARRSPRTPGLVSARGCRHA
jgi:hypothetical protein